MRTVYQGNQEKRLYSVMEQTFFGPPPLVEILDPPRNLHPTVIRGLACRRDLRQKGMISSMNLMATIY